MAHHVVTHLVHVATDERTVKNAVSSTLCEKDQRLECQAVCRAVQSLFNRFKSRNCQTEQGTPDIFCRVLRAQHADLSPVVVPYTLDGVA